MKAKPKMVVTLTIAALLAIAAISYLDLQGGRASHGLAAVASESTSSPEASTYITEYQVGGTNAQPNAIAPGSNGDMWFTLGSDYAIGELDPAVGTTREFRIPHQTGTLDSSGIAVDNTRGFIWFTDQGADSVWSFATATSAFTQYKLPVALSAPYQIAVDSQGDAWFTEISGGRIGEITPQGSLSEHTVPTGSATELTGPAGIAIGKGGVVWFTEVYEDSVGSFSNGVFDRYPIPGGSSPTGIALDSQGNLWVTLHGGNYIAKLDPDTNTTEIISTSIPGGVQQTLPYFVAVDPEGNVWFNEHYGNAIARFSPSNQTLVEYEIPSKVASLGNISGALTIGLDSKGHAWFTEDYTGKVGTVAPKMATPLILSVTRSGATADYTVAVEGEGPSTLASATSPGAPVTFSFSPASGTGPYTSSMTVARGSVPTSDGYEVTVSAVTPEVVCSQVVAF